MKKLITAFLFISAHITSDAQQWTTTGSNIANTNPGNVGIGTTSTPQAKLEVVGTSYFNGGRLTQSGNLANDNNAVFTNTSSTGYGIYSKGGLGSHYAFHFENQAGTSILYGRGDGFIGIGTTYPIAKLDVQGASNFAGGRLSQSGDMANDNNATFVNTSTTGYGIYSKGGLGTHYSFHFENQAGTSIIYGRSDGNVGIGTTSPDAKLTVKGDIHTREVRVDITGGVGPDYVFAPTYKLPTLESIKTYIEQNQHLPEVPSAKEMEANGINLGDMNMLLLKKIEELTLYVIEMKKENEAQQTEIEKLKNKK